MNRKFKLFFSLASLCLSVAMLCFGVYSAMSVNYSVSGTVSYEVTDVFVRIDLSVYRSMSTAPIGSTDNSTNASKIQSAEDITSLGFEKLDQFEDSVSSYNPETGEVEHSGQDWKDPSYDGLNFTYGTPSEDNNAYAFYIVLDITNYGSETINATVTNNTESTTANTRFAETDDVEIKASNGEPYSTNRIVLGLALEDATQSISDAMGDFSYTVNVKRGNLEYQVINDMMFAFDDINKTASLGAYTGSATEVKIPSSVSSITVEPKEVVLEAGWTEEKVMTMMTSDMGLYLSLMLPSTITFEDASTIKSLGPGNDIMAYEGTAMTITPLYVENGGSYTINEEFFGENGFAIPSNADELLYPIQFISFGVVSSATYKVGNGEEGEEVVVTADNLGEAVTKLTDICQLWVDYINEPSSEAPPAITFSNIHIFQTVEGNEYTVTEIEEFENNNIQKVTIPEGVMSIGDSAFSGCTQLTDITLPASLESIGSNAFLGTPWLETLQSENNGIATASDEATRFVIKAPTTIQSVDLTNVKVIAENAFISCHQLHSIVIPGSVISIGEHAFIFCNNLTSVTFEDSGGVWALDKDGAKAQVDVSKYTQSELATFLTGTYADYIWTKNV